MKSILTLSFLLLLSTCVFASGADTVHMSPNDVNMSALQTGSYNYFIYYTKTKGSPAYRMMLVKLNVQRTTYHNKPVIDVTQEWNLDSTVVHAAHSIFDAKDFSTLLHDTYWARLGYAMKFDFEKKTVDFTDKGAKGGIPDSIKAAVRKEFEGSFGKYNLNWHADLIVYQLLPYKEGRTFMINYYDPGFGAPEEVAYSVIGSEMLTGHDGSKVDCWILRYSDKNGSETFWVSKKAHEVLKEEDQGAHIFRYKIKTSVAIGE